MSKRNELNSYIARLQQRLRLGAWLRGAAIFTGTALFVTAFVFVFQYIERKASGKLVRGLVVALACGVLTALLVTLRFEELFYVRLP